MANKSNNKLRNKYTILFIIWNRILPYLVASKWRIGATYFFLNNLFLYFRDCCNIVFLTRTFISYNDFSFYDKSLFNSLWKFNSLWQIQYTVQKLLHRKKNRLKMCLHDRQSYRRVCRSTLSRCSVDAIFEWFSSKRCFWLMVTNLERRQRTLLLPNCSSVTLWRTVMAETNTVP